MKNLAVISLIIGVISLAVGIIVRLMGLKGLALGLIPSSFLEFSIATLLLSVALSLLK